MRPSRLSIGKMRGQRTEQRDAPHRAEGRSWAGAEKTTSGAKTVIEIPPRHFAGGIEGEITSPFSEMPRNGRAANHQTLSGPAADRCSGRVSKLMRRYRAAIITSTDVLPETATSGRLRRSDGILRGELLVGHIWWANKTRRAHHHAGNHGRTSGEIMVVVRRAATISPRADSRLALPFSPSSSARGTFARSNGSPSAITAPFGRYRYR